MARIVVFVLSHNYSGSTWLSLLLGSHSEAFYVGELKRLYSRDAPRPCRMCQESGRTCPYFGNVQNTRRRDIHHVTFEASGKRILVDNSKSINWCSKFLHDDRFQRKYVHLIRDPRGIYCSLLIRHREPDLEAWARQNREIRDFLARGRVDHILVTYDELAESTDETLSRICRWIGLQFQPEQKEYWHFRHHGPGANGATAAFLQNALASDPQFYAERRRTSFVDLRWKEQLTTDVVHSIKSDSKIRQVLCSLGLECSETGLLRNNEPCDAESTRL